MYSGVCTFARESGGRSGDLGISDVSQRSSSRGSGAIGQSAVNERTDAGVHMQGVRACSKGDNGGIS